MSILIGDTHWRSKEPYKAGLIKLFDWLVKNYSDEILIQSGDFFHTSRPSWEIYDIAIEYALQFKEFYFIPGSHDHSKQIGLSTKSFRKHKSIFLYDKQTVATIGKFKWLMLPYRYSQDEVQAYNDITGTFDFGLAHMGYKGSNFGVDELDLKAKFKYKMFYGHIHLPFNTGDDKHIIITVPQPTREAEQHHTPRIFHINDDTGECKEIELPVFMTIETITYDEEPKSKNNLINIIDAPSFKSIEERYSEKDGYYIRKDGIKILRTENELSDVDLKKGFTNSLEEKFVEYAKEREESKELVDCVLNYFGKVGES